MKYTLLLTLVVSLFATSLMATEKEKFTPNVDDISQQLESDQLLLDTEFKSLELLEDKIKAENLTFEQLEGATIAELALKEDVKGALVAVAGADDLPLGIPGFWWGFCLGLIGILLVYILMEDSPDRKEETKKALIGALIWVGIWILLWVVFLLEQVPLSDYHSYMKKYLGRSGGMLLLLFSFLTFASAQDFFRFRADFTLKEISTLNDSIERRLIIGSCYYDKNLDKLTYNLTFPASEQWIVADSFIYTIKDGVTLSKSAVPPITEHNIFRMLLDQTFSEFGMIKSGYEIEKVKRKGTEVYVTYKPPDQFSDVLGSLVLIKERKKLKGAIYYEPDGNMMFRQQLLNYEVIDGLPIPTEMTHIVEKGGKKIKRILTFEQIKVNETENEVLYNAPVGSLEDQ